MNARAGTARINPTYYSSTPIVLVSTIVKNPDENDVIMQMTPHAPYANMTLLFLIKSI